MLAERLSEAHRAGLVRTAEFQFGLRNEDARDLVQEVVADWLDYSHRNGESAVCKSEDHLLATLAKMLVQRWIDRTRRGCASDKPLDTDMPTKPSTMDIAERIARQEVIQREFCRLPKPRRIALRWLFVDGLTQDEVSARIGVDRRLVSEWKRQFEERLRGRAEAIGLDD